MQLKVRRQLLQKKKENEAGAENIVADASEEKPDQSREDQQV